MIGPQLLFLSNYYFARIYALPLLLSRTDTLCVLCWRTCVRVCYRQYLFLLPFPIFYYTFCFAFLLLLFSLTVSTQKSMCTSSHYRPPSPFLSIVGQAFNFFTIGLTRVRLLFIYLRREHETKILVDLGDSPTLSHRRRRRRQRLLTLIGEEGTIRRDGRNFVLHLNIGNLILATLLPCFSLPI